MKPANAEGYVLMVVAVALVVIATLSLSLFANTNEANQQLASRYELQQLQYALDAGIEHTKAKLLSNNSCTGYATVSGSLPGATYSSSLNATSGSPIKASVTATHASGLQRTSVFDLTTYAAELSLTIEASEDTHVKKDAQNDNKGDDKRLHSQAQGDDKDEHMLLLFDLSAIPASSFVRQATLSMRLRTSDNNNDPDNVYRIARSWQADEATWVKYESGIFAYWLEAGGQHQYHIWGSFPDSIVGTKTADISGLVRLWHAGLPNYGMLLRSIDDANNSHKHYYSSDENNASRRPKLLVDYRCECDSTC